MPSTQQRYHFVLSFMVALGNLFLGGVDVERVVWPPLILGVSWEQAGYCSLGAITLIELRLSTKLHAKIKMYNAAHRDYKTTIVITTASTTPTTAQLWERVMKVVVVMMMNHSLTTTVLEYIWHS